MGGTGTLGRALIEALSKDKRARHDIYCISRDELKQQQLRAEFPHVRFSLCDIRDRDALMRVMPDNVHALFHVAALKHIDVLQANPEESVKTNILGTINVSVVAEAKRVQHVVFSSTDKAEAPINVYGMCKAISEQILLGRNVAQSTTQYAVYRWGNVLGSRGSAIDGFIKQVKSGDAVKLTHPEMTRFWIKIEDAVKFMLTTYDKASLDAPMIPPIKAASVVNLVHAIGSELGPMPDFETIGVRPGEKLHESLSPVLHSDEGPFYTPQELRSLVRPFVEAHR